MNFPNSVCFILLWSCTCFLAFAQQKSYIISGTIKNTDGEPVPGATIQVKRLGIGTITDANGRYQINGLNDGIHNLQVTHIGYEPQTKTITLAGNNLVENFMLVPSSLQLKEVRVDADLFKSGPKEQSLTVQTVDRSFLEKSGSNTFVNALQKVPGVNAINTGVGIAKPVIRGMSFNRVIVTDQGVKQEGQQWGADHGLEIDQYAPERVEIVKGPSSLLYGSDGMGGVINILPAPLPPSNTLSGSFLGTYKNNNHLFGTSTMLQGNREGKLFRLRFSTQDFGDYRVPADSFTYNRFVLPIYDQALKNTAGRERNITAMAGLEKHWGQATVTVSNFHQKAGFFSGALGIPREYQLTPDGDTRNIALPRQVTDHFKIIANGIVHFERNWLELDMGYQNNYRREESNPHAHGKGPRPEGTLALGLMLQTFSANAKFNHQVSDKIKRIYGFQTQYQLNERSGFEYLLSDFTSGNAGIFVHEEYQINTTTSVNGGIRFDYGYRNIEEYTEPVYDDQENITGYSTRSGNVERQFSNFSGGMGVSFYPHQHFNAKLNLGSSFKIPTAPELSANGIHHGTFRHEFGDSTLNTERGWQADLNLTYRTEKFYASFTPFFNFFEQYIYLGPTSQFSPLPEGGQIYRYRQDDAIFTGTEATIEYAFLKGFHVKTALEYVWNYNLNTQLALPFTPPLSILGEAEYHLPLQGIFSNLYLGVLAQYFASQMRVDRNEEPTPGYTLMNFSSGIDINISNQRIELMFSIQNLFNTNYLNHLSRYRLLNLPEQGRNFNITLKFPFSLVENN
ncbi:TonB-dependent receptor [Fulvivirga sp. M361]|uniref:TonB-dependent receptor n=1 Tax=Fulvivirga sp. M361 TaxID=2594266 RepID=UPI00117A146B|nr:TonB-dependent receptor [Fulvivirga sp. M361]TRX51734.1 TonB-dependent receptor [Fulvivirga sp. M361]